MNFAIVNTNICIWRTSTNNFMDSVPDIKVVCLINVVMASGVFPVMATSDTFLANMG